MITALTPRRTHARLPDGDWRVTVTPPSVTGFHSNSLTLTADQFARYQGWLQHGVMIQDALPDLSVDAREILLSGIGPDDWEEFSHDE